MSREFWILKEDVKDLDLEERPSLDDLHNFIHMREIVEGEITDTMRLDWMIKNGKVIMTNGSGNYGVSHSTCTGLAKFETPRLAIDAAMKESK